MEGSIKDLSKYRFESAGEDLECARVLLEDKKFKASVNRSQFDGKMGREIILWA